MSLLESPGSKRLGICGGGLSKLVKNKDSWGY